MGFSFTACNDKEKESIDGLSNEIFGDQVRNVENITGTFHYDNEINEWYAEDDSHTRYYFLSVIGIHKEVIGASEGVKVQFSGLLFSIANEWLKNHKQYEQFKSTGLYCMDYDNSIRTTYTIL